MDNVINSLLRSYVLKKKFKRFQINDASDSGDSKKPKIITFYSMIKGAFDVVIRLKSEYSVTRISNR